MWMIKNIVRRWTKWSLPSKLTAIGTFIAIISFGWFLYDKISDSSNSSNNSVVQENTSIPQIAMKFFNSTNSTVSLVPINEFILWLPQGVSNYAPNIAGKMEMKVYKNTDSLISQIVIKSKDSLLVLVKILNEKKFYRYYKADDCDIDFMIRKTNGQFVENNPFPFREKYILSGYIPVKIN